jgi:V/A-type H+/Na+-transporting ATPase subunit D
VAKVKLTKNELRDQEHKLSQLTKYLPTLQLKKGLLQQEVFKARLECKKKEENFQNLREELINLNYLFAQTPGVDFSEVVQIEHLNKRYDNIAGVDVPTVEGIEFKKVDYSLFASPLWADSLVNKLQKYVYAREEVYAAKEKQDNLEKELRDVSIRVNLFEKIMIPRTQTAIKKIKVFLSDQQLMAVCQAKAAQKKVNRI